MGLVNFYPMIGDENGLPVYVRGIGVGHEQERKRFVTADGTIHLHMTITGCGILTLGEKRKMLPVGTMMLTPPGTLLDLTPAPSGWMDNWIGIVAKDDVVTRFGDGIRVFTPVDPGAINQQGAYGSHIARTSSRCRGRLQAAYVCSFRHRRLERDKHSRQQARFVRRRVCRTAFQGAYRPFDALHGVRKCQPPVFLPCLP